MATGAGALPAGDSRVPTTLVKKDWKRDVLVKTDGGVAFDRV